MLKEDGVIKSKNQIIFSEDFIAFSIYFDNVLSKTNFSKIIFQLFCTSGGFRVCCSQLWCPCTNASLTPSPSNALSLARVWVPFSFRASIGYGIAQCSLCNYVLLVDISTIEGAFLSRLFLSSLKRQTNFALLYLALSLVEHPTGIHYTIYSVAM